MFFTAKNYLALYQQKLFSPVFSVVLAVNCRTVLACASRRPSLPLHLTAVPARGAAVHACHYALIGQCRLSTYYTLWFRVRTRGPRRAKISSRRKRWGILPEPEGLDLLLSQDFFPVRCVSDSLNICRLLNDLGFMIQLPRYSVKSPLSRFPAR